MHWFGKSKKKTAEAPKDSILQMRNTLEMLEKKEKHLDTKIAQEVATARAQATTNKQAALMALKRKKMYEQQRENLRGARFNLESQVLAIENANVNKETIDAMRTGANAMKSIHGELNIDKVENAMDDVREQMDLANEITAAISQPLGMDMGMDLDELDAELEELEQEALDASLLDAKAGPMPTLPDATAAKPVAAPATAAPAMTAEEAELEELRASMAL